MLGVLGSSGRQDRIVRMAAVSPRSALAELTGAVRAPFLFSVTATFATTTQEFTEGDMDATILGADTWIEDLVFDVQVPSAFAGNVFQSLYQFFYNKTNGIAVEIKVLGSPRYDVAQAPVPLTNAADFIGSERWPDGWLLTRNEGVHMRFVPLVVLPNAPVTITTTFRGWQYICPDLEAISLDLVWDKLKGLGLDVDQIKLARSFRAPY